MIVCLARSPPQIKQAALISSNKVAQDFVDAMPGAGGQDGAGHHGLDLYRGTPRSAQHCWRCLSGKSGLQDVFPKGDLTDDLTLNLDEFVGADGGLGFKGEAKLLEEIYADIDCDDLAGGVRRVPRG